MESFLLFLFFLFWPWEDILLSLPEPVIIPPMQPLWEYSISRYYSVIPGQRRYYLSRTYEEDLAMNCGSTCLETANGYHLTHADEFKIVACPPSFKLWTQLYVEWLGTITCQDRGGSIKWKRLDLWVGIWDRGLDNIWNHPEKAGKKQVYLLPQPYER